MIHEVDEALSALLGAEILGTTGVEVLFDAPTREWAARRNAPTVNAFLYDIKEDPSRRGHGRRRELGSARGELLAEHEPPRWFALSYLVTAWTKRPQDEHRLLSVLLAGLIGQSALEPERLSGALAQLGLPLPYTVAAAPAGGRGPADVWSALGGELKPSLDLVVTAPIAGVRRLPAALVTDALLLRVSDAGGGVGAAGELRRPRFEDEPPAPARARAAEPMGARRARGAAARASRPGGIAR